MAEVPFHRVARFWVAVGWTAALASCGAGTDYYAQTGYMARLGEDARRDNGRRIGEFVVPQEARQPAVVPITVGDEAMFQLTLADGTAPTAGEAVTQQAPTIARAMSIELDGLRLAEFARTNLGVQVSDVKAINGRANGDANALRVEYVPQVRDEDTAIRQLLLICAAIVGMDTARSVDSVVALVTDRQALPWMSVKTDIRAFQAYESGELSLTQWKQRIEIQRF